MRIQIALAFALSSISLTSAAADAAPPLLPIASFVNFDQYYNPSLSPDGKHLAVTVRTPVGKRLVPMVTFYSLPDLKLESVVRMPAFGVPVDYDWVSNTRLVVQKGIEVGTREQPQATGEVLAMEYDGSGQQYLFGFDMFKYGSKGDRYGDDYGYAYPTHIPRPRNGHVVLSTYLWDSDHSSLYDVDSRSGARKLVAMLKSPRTSFVVQRDGKPRFALGSDEQSRFHLWQMDDQQGKWVDYVETDKNISYFSPFRFSADNRQVFAWYAEHGGPVKLLSQDLQTGARKQLAGDDLGDLKIALMGNIESPPYAVKTGVGRPKLLYLDETAPDAVLLKDLSRQFPDHSVSLLSSTEDNSKILFWVYSDRDPGAYYLYDRKSNKADMLFASMPDIEPDDMAERRPVSFAARDGLRIDGFLTLPRRQSDRKPPLILIPHGGPVSQDQWNFDVDAQFLANRGYAVLQVNFRGSAGKGKRFEEMGYRQWGGKIMDDLVDGVRWAVQQEQVDGTRMCVYGASFGGYSALMLASREPDLFKCAVGYAGVYNIELMTKEEPSSNTRYRAVSKRYFGDDKAEWERYSPDLHADTIKAPVLLIHGGKDERAPKEHAFRMKAALEKAGHPPEWYYVDYEGHGFYDTENQTAVYQKLEAFFGKYLR